MDEIKQLFKDRTVPYLDATVIHIDSSRKGFCVWVSAIKYKNKFYCHTVESFHYPFSSHNTWDIIERHSLNSVYKEITEDEFNAYPRPFRYVIPDPQHGREIDNEKQPVIEALD